MLSPSNPTAIEFENILLRISQDFTAFYKKVNQPTERKRRKGNITARKKNRPKILYFRANYSFLYECFLRQRIKNMASTPKCRNAHT